MSDNLNALNDEIIIDVKPIFKVLIFAPYLAWVIMISITLNDFVDFLNPGTIEWIIFILFATIPVIMYLVMRIIKTTLRASGITKHYPFSTRETPWNRVKGHHTERSMKGYPVLYVDIVNMDGKDDKFTIATGGTTISLEEAEALIDRYMEKYGSR